MTDLFDLTGKVALVTGGSRGLGRAMCLAFAERGADVVIVSRKQENCESLAREIEALGRRALAAGVNVGDWQQLDDLVEAAYNTFGRIDVLVNNAGMSPLYPSLEEVSEALFDKVVAVNLKGPFRLAALIGSRMAKGEGGSIINVSSTAAVHPAPDAAIYGAAKAGLNHLTETLAQVLGPKVRVNCIMPGPFLTDISKAWDMQAFNERAKLKALRRGGEPEEIIGAALYLASKASSFTTGAIIKVDGG
ncbi:MAG: SDR family oxidoreductase [Gammaproteobacteria bacterium]|nr:SDR family oxidoreductase [Gammaproteobacteria bacterium]MCY4198677.1 SDR family oxidoreductase [Gammaproteobacteria bacterium]MCY4276857.1 SDR family oxidoreductase [Gammaproteobacteria bacterium]MCY4323683.1 SDR family oxidoreductase [Gammaproteobacteria bacterium]